MFLILAKQNKGARKVYQNTKANRKDTEQREMYVHTKTKIGVIVKMTVKTF